MEWHRERFIDMLASAVGGSPHLCQAYPDDRGEGGGVEGTVTYSTAVGGDLRQHQGSTSMEGDSHYTEGAPR